MPMVRAMRLINALEAGTLTGAQLQTLLADTGRLAELQSLCQMRGQSRRMAAGGATMAGLMGSALAVQTAFASGKAWEEIMASAVARDAIADSAVAVTELVADAAKHNEFLATPDGPGLLAASSAAMGTIAASTAGMDQMIASAAGLNAMIASQTALDAIAASSTALAAMFGSSVPRQAMFGAPAAWGTMVDTANSLTWLRANKALTLVSPVPDGNTGAYQAYAGAPASILMLGVRNNGTTTGLTHYFNTRANGTRNISASSTSTTVFTDLFNAFSNLEWNLSSTQSTSTYRAFIQYVDMT